MRDQTGAPRPGSRPGGIDSCERLRHEAEVLTRFAGDARFPQNVRLTLHNADLFLAIDDIEGETLESHIGNLACQGLLPPRATLIWLARELASAIGTIHDRGLVYRDLKSSNVLISGDKIRLIDFELAEAIGDVPRHGRGTRGYCCPQQFGGLPAAVTDDIYGLGAVLYFAGTGAEPSLAPDQFNLLTRPPELLNPDLDVDIADLIRRCLAENPKSRFDTIADLGQALAALNAHASPPFQVPARVSGDPSSRTADQYRSLSRRLADSLWHAARPRTPEEPTCWTSKHDPHNPIVSRDLSAGNAGSLLAFSNAVLEFDEPEHRLTLAAAADWLLHSSGFEGAPLPGLFVGEAGVGAALLRSGQVLGDKALLAEAAARGRYIATLPHLSPDFFNGTAGRLLFHLLLWDETTASEHLEDAIRAGEVLLQSAESVGDDGARWTIPDGYDGLSGSAYLGYAHGAAGIADMLLELYEATGDGRFLSCAQKAGNWLAHTSVDVLNNASSTNWGSVEGETPGAAFWCHGATGVGLFFLHASQLQAVPGADALALRAARTVLEATRWAGPTQCHGLAGNIEYLLDVAAVTHDESWVSGAGVLADLLESFAVERDGVLGWSSESPDIVTPDYMVGYAGVFSALLRLAEPMSHPRLLSRSGFRRKLPATAAAFS